ncbi:MAG: hypothetical protein NPINA01_02180 [Nitrospinaceae bacterium]|nr:MAG: hypothetical protein NPINA01_02180 [Nitrospinaceae bacterium]
MTDPLQFILLMVAFTLTAGLAFATVKGSGLVKIGWLNFSRLKELSRQKVDTENRPRQMALQAVIEHCQSLQKQWILRAPDLDISRNTHALLEQIASTFHPQSKAPLMEARLGKLLEAFLELKNRILVFSRIKGVRRFTQFRLRHVHYLSRAWQKKQQWQESAVGRAFSRYKLAGLFQWLYLLIRFMDLTFWMFKMLGYILHDIVLKILLIRWYLTLGELAIAVYSEQSEDPELQADELLSQLGSIPEQEIPDELPSGVREIADASRNGLMFKMSSLEWGEAKGIYACLVKNIAGHYFPQADQPLYEVKLYPLIMAVSRLSDQVASIRNKPVLNKLLGIRVSHLLLAKDAMDFVNESELGAWLKKYPIGRFMKISRLLYQTVQKKHPGVLFKDFAFFLVKEAGKRWILVYLHDKIALEANHACKESLP